MDTKEAIEFLENIRPAHCKVGNKEKIDGIIDLLKQGERYRQMWGKLEEEHKNITIVDHFNKMSYDVKDDVFYELKDIKQKYFLKG